ncbi:MAG: hypothetical protein A2029_01285 [Chloroflexi bacterium RBG_19FT_COMBO_47_9]|nr:MAG: hypothetical protein A2029_01285 [Chloroflexi bacterium RBG_19FT_COMBO_47_9]
MKPYNLQYSGAYTVILLVAFLTSCNPSVATTPPQKPTETTHVATNQPIPDTLTVTPIPLTPTKTPIPRTSTPTKVPTRTPRLANNAEDILGIWLGIETRQGMYIRFNEDGTYQLAKSRSGLDTQPNVEGTYSFDGNQLTFTITSVHDLQDCGFTDSIYEVVMLVTGQIEFIKVKDSCSDRVNTTAQIHERRQ